MSLSGQQFKTLRDGLAAAFDYDAFEQMLKLELDKTLRNIVEKGPMNTVTFRVIDLAEREGWTLDLLRAARVANPNNPALHQAAEMLSLSSTRELKPAALNFEKVVREGVPFLDPAAFRSRLGRIELQVCSVELDGVGQGSGILVGADYVLTNQHVVASVTADTKLECRFDFAASADGKVIDPGTAVAVSGGVRDSSPPSGNDPNLTNGNPTGDELDYALLQLEREIGHEPAGSGKNIDAPVRSWTQLAAGAIGIGDPIVVLQHPQNPVTWNLEPLKLTMGRTLDLVGNGLRLRHDANTLPGSSGSPCFSASLALVALHHAGGDSRYEKADYNQAIPIGKIIDRLGRSGIDPFWKEAPPK
jgi:hypothetical protein